MAVELSSDQAVQRAAEVLRRAEAELDQWAKTYSGYEIKLGAEIARRQQMMRRLPYLLFEGAEGDELVRLTDQLEAATELAERG
jgi:hypothetical protein